MLTSLYFGYIFDSALKPSAGLDARHVFLASSCTFCEVQHCCLLPGAHIMGNQGGSASLSKAERSHRRFASFTVNSPALVHVELWIGLVPHKARDVHDKSRVCQILWNRTTPSRNQRRPSVFWIFWWYCCWCSLRKWQSYCQSRRRRCERTKILVEGLGVVN